LERGVLAATRQRDEPLIGLQPEQGRGAPQAGGGARMRECGDLHRQSKAALSLIDTVTAGKLRSGYSRQVALWRALGSRGPGRQTGKVSGLKIRRPQGFTGSSPVPGIERNARQRWGSCFRGRCEQPPRRRREGLGAKLGANGVERVLV